MKCHATLLGAILLVLASALCYAQAPVPFINLPLVPDATAPGGPDFTLTVNGTGFVSNSVVNWNGTALATQFVSGSQLTATVPAADIATASTGWVTVVNPAPGGGTSNTAFFSVKASTASVAFQPYVSYTTGYGPYSVALGDVNGDHRLDAVVANAFSSSVSVLIGNGDGTFQSQVQYPTDASPVAVGLADLNGDGKLDLVVESSTGTVSVLLGNGDGTFQPHVDYPTGPGPYKEIAIADLNGDGYLDVVVPDLNNFGPGFVAVILGNGDGTLQPPVEYPTGVGDVGVAVGDFNGDGKLDVATANASDPTVSVLLGNGDGTFRPHVDYPLPTSAYSVAVGDFNADGKLDLVLSTGGAGAAVYVLLGNGDGTFQPAVQYATSGNPVQVVVADFNADGKLDVAVSTGADTVSVLLGNGDGTFQRHVDFPIGPYGYALDAADLDGDGTVDVVTADVFSESVGVLLDSSGAQLKISPTSLTFGTQLIGTTSDPQPVTLTNSGSAPLKISKIAKCGAFSQTNNCPSKVLPGGQCTINVTFTPILANSHTGSVTIRDNASNSPQTISLTGVGTWVALSPASLDFGNQSRGTTSPPQVVTLTNYDQAAVNISRIRLTGSNPAVFAQTNTCGSSVPAGGSCTISVTFAPKYYGYRTATLEVNDNGGGRAQTAAVSGTGTR